MTQNVVHKLCAGGKMPLDLRDMIRSSYAGNIDKVVSIADKHGCSYSSIRGAIASHTVLTDKTIPCIKEIITEVCIPHCEELGGYIPTLKKAAA